jgi:hypothetical protein
MTRFIGLDLGQQHDYTALVLSEPVDAPTGKKVMRQKTNRHGVILGPVETDELHTVHEVRHLQRWPLGTGYPEIVEHVRKMIASPELEDEPVCLALDATGVGRPVYDMFLAELGWVSGGLLPVVIHGGADEHHHSGVARVPKRELVSRAVKLLQKRELKIATTLPFAETLIGELKAFRLKINVNTGHDSYEAWRERDHDDLVLALCIALWAAEKGSVAPFVVSNFVR